MRNKKDKHHRNFRYFSFKILKNQNEKNRWEYCKILIETYQVYQVLAFPSYKEYP